MSSFWLFSTNKGYLISGKCLHYSIKVKIIKILIEYSFDFYLVINILRLKAGRCLDLPIVCEKKVKLHCELKLERIFIKLALIQWLLLQDNQ